MAYVSLRVSGVSKGWLHVERFIIRNPALCPLIGTYSLRAKYIYQTFETMLNLM